MQVSDKTILLVDDEAYTLEFLSYNLAQNGFRVLTSTNGKDAILKAKTHIPSIIVLDIMMPEMDGIETCIQMRKIEKLNDTAIAFLSCRGEDYTQIVGFEAGADEYIKKPIRINLLIERLKALEKRVQRMKKKMEDSELLIIDKERFLVVYKGSNVELTQKEFNLLNKLYINPNKIVSKEELMIGVWGNDDPSSSRTVHVHISRIRKKLDPGLIETVKGIGFRYRPPEG